MALPRAYRLKQRRAFDKVYQQGKRRRAAHLHLVAWKRPCRPSISNPGNSGEAIDPAPPSQIGISISRKVSKRAVVRNRIKRQIRAAFRQLLPRLKPGWLLIVVVRSEAIECDYWQFLQELEKLLAEAEVLYGDSRGSVL
ncbi:MAG: ribonuclease P protein component [Synechococcales bacterium]|nr:ribonuclease P protein component [Synechococcales bacterium]